MPEREISYGAIPTTYAGVRFRSRLEARFAAFLDSYQLSWNYEPFELQEYIPDFVVELSFGPLLFECKPAVLPQEFVWPCTRVTRSGWVGPAIVVGSSLAAAPDDWGDLVMFGSTAAEEGGWSRVGRGRWPAAWGEYPFADVRDRWVEAGNVVQWKAPTD